MVEGRREEAVQEALRFKQFGLALFIARMCGPDLSQHVMKEFAENVFARGSPLSTVASLFSSDDGQFADPGSLFGDEELLRASWKRHLTALISNLVPGWKKATVSLGDQLRKMGEYSAAHFCYMVCGASMGRPMKTSTKWALAGCDMTPMDVVLNTEASLRAFARTEGYEWAKQRANPKAMIRSLLPFKLVYCHMLVDVGLTSSAQAYLDSLLPYFESIPDEGMNSPGFVAVPLGHLVAWGDRYGMKQNAHDLAARLSRTKRVAEEAEGDASFLTAHSTLDPKNESSKNNDSSAGMNGEYVVLPEPKKTDSKLLNQEADLSATPAPLGDDKLSSPLPFAPPKASSLPPTGLPSTEPVAPPMISVSHPIQEPKMGEMSMMPGHPPREHKTETGGQPIKPVAPPRQEAKDEHKAEPQTKDEKIPSTPMKVAPSPVSAPANLGKQSTPKRMIGMVKGLFGLKQDEDNAVHADLGGKMEAYYDKEKKRWIFPGDDPNAEDFTAGPPPTAAELKKTPVEEEEKKAPQDPLAAMMAPPSRAPRSAIPQKKTPMLNPGGMPPSPPKFAVFTPKPNDN